MEKKSILINDKIRFPTLIVIDQQGKKHDGVPREKAIAMAEEGGLDLVLLTEKPLPVARIISASAFFYAHQKKEKANRKKQKMSEMTKKHVKLSIRIDTHDMNRIIKHIQEFIDKGHRVVITIRLSKKERDKMDKAKELMSKVCSSIVSAQAASMEMLPNGVSTLLSKVSTKT